MTFSAAPRAIVVDASAAIPYLQGDPDWDRRVEAWLQAGDFLLVPPHFRLEVSNGLVRGTSIKSESEVIERVRVLFEIGIESADRGILGLEATIRLAARHGLTVYDAAYLELALDVDGELATLDRALQKAATAEGVPLVIAQRKAGPPDGEPA